MRSAGRAVTHRGLSAAPSRPAAQFPAPPFGARGTAALLQAERRAGRLVLEGADVAHRVDAVGDDRGLDVALGQGGRLDQLGRDALLRGTVDLLLGERVELDVLALHL